MLLIPAPPSADSLTYLLTQWSMCDETRTRVGECRDWSSWDDQDSVSNTKRAMVAAAASMNIAPVTLSFLPSTSVRMIALRYLANYSQNTTRTEHSLWERRPPPRVIRSGSAVRAWSPYPGSVLEENIGGGARQKVDDLFKSSPSKHRPKLPNQPLQPSKKCPLYNCLLVLLLLQPKIWRERLGFFLGGGAIAPPLSRRKTAPVHICITSKI